MNTPIIGLHGRFLVLQSANTQPTEAVEYEMEMVLDGKNDSLALTRQIEHAEHSSARQIAGR